mmetsp:Transcript_54504/g.165043  ORF Transcript_54504/g.165043 Transcript_54504/m.165043 type:complete len:185 (+) Transcript_54504:69-623(+)
MARSLRELLRLGTSKTGRAGRCQQAAPCAHALRTFWKKGPPPKLRLHDRQGTTCLSQTSNPREAAAAQGLATAGTVEMLSSLPGASSDVSWVPPSGWMQPEATDQGTSMTSAKLANAILEAVVGVQVGLGCRDLRQITRLVDPQLQAQDRLQEFPRHPRCQGWRTASSRCRRSRQRVPSHVVSI